MVFAFKCMCTIFCVTTLLSKKIIATDIVTLVYGQVLHKTVLFYDIVFITGCDFLLLPALIIHNFSSTIDPPLFSFGH